MKVSLFALIVFVAAFVASGASAAVSDGTKISAEQLAPLAAWVELHTHVPMQILPTAVASDRKLEKALHFDDAQYAGAVGAYMPGRLVVSNRVWDPASLEAQSYVVHELVHHAQFLNSRAYPCHAAKEREAYMLQSEWLIEHGQKPIVTQAWIDRMASCD